jgi:NMD protein affecting ribosome stability and mRNA decay
MEDPFSGPGQCIECGDFDDLHSGLCEVCIEKRDLEAWEQNLEDEQDAAF